jgi:signal transduction histidine kinase
MLKPVDHQDLLVTLRRALEAYDMRKRLEEYHRGLEGMVRQRTRELEEANQELRRNHENLLRTQGQLIMREKMAFLGSMSAGIAHELKNPLNFIINFAKNVEETAREVVSAHAPALSALPMRDDESVLALLQEVRGDTERIAFHGERANEVITMMMKLSRESASPREPANLNEVLSRYLELAHQGARPRLSELELKIEKELDPELGAVVLSDMGMGRVVTSLVNNSLESMALKRRKHGASFEPCLRVRTRGLPDKVEIRFWDNGMGIPPKVLPQVFHPFFTTKADSKNIGLGLAIAYDIVVQEHGGQFEVHAAENEYAEFVVRLPRS